MWENDSLISMAIALAYWCGDLTMTEKCEEKLKRGKKVDFISWTKIDLSELLQAPFHNPSNIPKAWDFKSFLEDQAKKNFTGMKIDSSFTNKSKGVINPHTNKTMVNFMWPPTAKRLPDGTLDSMRFWVYDEATSTVVIRIYKTKIRLVDPKDLLKFGERDIRRLASMQIMTENLIFESATKAFIGMVVTIVEKKLWAGVLENADVHLVTKGSQFGPKSPGDFGGLGPKLLDYITTRNRGISGDNCRR
ncbi:hypothetical protein LXL04_020440 [Taraxacum kok-saghyz]